MGIDGSWVLAALLLLVGFHFVFAGKTPLQRVLAWCLLQAGPWVLVLSFSTKEDPLGRAMVFTLFAVGCLVASALYFLAKLQPAAPKERKGKAR
jgi:hypothetical protein